MPKPRIVRSPPPLPFQDAPGGQCRACGVEILTKLGKPHKGRKWCDEHRVFGALLHNPAKARAAVFMRDVGICSECGTDCTHYRTLSGISTRYFQSVEGRPYNVQINREKAVEWCKAMLFMPPRVKAWVIDLGQWEVDHAMPLHLVDRTDPEAWKQWTLENLRTRCMACHEEKTTKEAKVRAKIRRIRGENKPKLKRKIQSRGFDKAKRPMRRV